MAMEAKKQHVRLPAHVMDKYRTYKYATSSFVGWMASMIYGSSSQCCGIRAVDELSYLTDEVLCRGIQIPLTIFQTLRTAVKARVQVSNYFCTLQSDGVQSGNLNHDYFNAVLAYAYTRIRTQFDKAISSPTCPETAGINIATNSFCYLDSSNPEPASSMGDPKNHHHRHHERHHGNLRPLSHKRQDLRTGDAAGSKPEVTRHKPSEDVVEEFMALTSYLRQMESLAKTTLSTWEEVAKARITSVVGAVVVTNIAFEMARSFEPSIHAHRVFNPCDFLSRYEECSKTLGTTHPHLLDHSASSALSPLLKVWHVLEHFRDGWLAAAKGKDRKTYKPPKHDEIPIDNASSLFDGAEADETENGFLLQLLHRMGELISIDRTDDGATIKCRAVMNQTPLVQYLGLFLNKGVTAQTVAAETSYAGCSAPTFALCFGLQMMVDGTHAMKARESLSTPFWRVQTLQLMGDVKRSLDRLVAHNYTPCRCLRINDVCVADELIYERARVARVMTVKRFDAFYQTPWLSGANVLETLLNNACCGLKAWHHGYFVGRTLHIFNCLVTLNVLDPDEVELFNGLCDQFVGTVFLGQRPERSLWSTYQRWAGGRLHFKNGDRSRGATLHASYHAKRWSLKCVEDASQGGNNGKRCFDATKVSLTFCLASKGYQVDDEVLAMLCAGDQGKPKPKQLEDARRGLSTGENATELLQKVKERVATELEATIPVLKLNPCAVYETCVEVLQDINGKEHEDKIEYICPCIMERLLRAADEQIARKGKSITELAEKGLMEHAKEAFVKAMKGKRIKDFCWENEVFN